MTTIPPTPYQALIDAGFSPDDARNALRAIVKSGYEPEYRGPKEAYKVDLLIQFFAHSAQHAEEILQESGIGDGPAEIRQGNRILKVDYLNVDGFVDPRPAGWFDHTVDDTVAKLTAQENS